LGGPKFRGVGIPGGEIGPPRGRDLRLECFAKAKRGLLVLHKGEKDEKIVC